MYAIIPSVRKQNRQLIESLVCNYSNGVVFVEEIYKRYCLSKIVYTQDDDYILRPEDLFNLSKEQDGRFDIVALDPAWNNGKYKPWVNLGYGAIINSAKARRILDHAINTMPEHADLIRKRADTFWTSLDLKVKYIKASPIPITNEHGYRMDLEATSICQQPNHMTEKLEVVRLAKQFEYRCRQEGISYTA